MTRRLTALDRARELNGATEQQQLLGHRGLARIRVRNNGEGAALLGFRIKLDWRAGHGGGNDEKAGDCSGWTARRSKSRRPQLRLAGGGCPATGALAPREGQS